MLDVEGEKCLDHTYSAMVKEMQSAAWKDDSAGQILFSTCYILTPIDNFDVLT